MNIEFYNTWKNIDNANWSISLLRFGKKRYIYTTDYFFALLGFEIHIKIFN